MKHKAGIWAIVLLLAASFVGTSGLARSVSRSPWDVPPQVASACADIKTLPGTDFTPLAVYAPANYLKNGIVFVCVNAPPLRRHNQRIVQTFFSAKGHALSGGDNMFRCLTKAEEILPICNATRFVSPSTIRELCLTSKKVGQPRRYECDDPSMGFPTYARFWWQWTTKDSDVFRTGSGEIDVKRF